ncbi:unnamed protein product [Didymodactylos carnosus]|uniref:Uncharacterized protein n=1 Tax=Didymodactylos carnosus TaxID=1234261 RepID=A0A814ZYN6_9BILA|nr:unnamed protein product [Didymodactylos carnosus]CAF1250259.1 unnamed protein product [Didymodactylos carnosus]CAF3818399.1 unnamed protein product [Didymodactylos carnosus]CAF4019110.1 unnamed protein product [Didymodactylos carnosus]
MALSAAEKNKRLREKQKATGQHDSIKKKDRQRKKLAHSNLSPKHLAELRLKQNANLRKLCTKSKQTLV